MADHRHRLLALDGLEAPELWSKIEGRTPRSDARDLDPPRGRRAVTVAVALAVGLASILIANTALGPTGRSVGSLNTTTWTSEGLEGLHLTFRRPPEWHVQPFDELVGRVGFSGAVVSNTDHTLDHPDLGPNDFTTLWDLSALPQDSVVISIEHLEGGPAMTEGSTDPRYPLDLAKSEVVPSPSPGPGWTNRWLTFVAGGVSSNARIWFGPEASVHDREIARRIVASIAPIPPPAIDGWIVGVEVLPDRAGPLRISVGPARPAPENDAHPWIQHTIILRNTGSETLFFDDTRISRFLGLPDPELLAADHGCGYGSASEGAPVEAGVCLLYLAPFSIPPHGEIRKTVTLFKDLNGMAPLADGRYVFPKIYRFRVGSSAAERTLHVRIVYDVRSV